MATQFFAIWRYSNMYIQTALDFGQLVRDRRRLLGWTQADLAKRAGVGRPWLVELEHGKSGAPLRLLLRTLRTLGYAMMVVDEGPARSSLHGPHGSQQVSSKFSRESRGRIEVPEGRRRSAKLFEGSAQQRSAERAVEVADTHEHILKQVADLEAAGFTPKPDEFYDLGYRPVLRRMATYVISIEAPIFADVLARRIARAHGFARAASRIQMIIREVIEHKFTQSTESDRTIIWPEDADVNQLPAFRSASIIERDHVDIPLVELASLAHRFIVSGSTPAETVVLMSRTLGLERVLVTTRKRLEEALRLALHHK